MHPLKKEAITFLYPEIKEKIEKLEYRAIKEYTEEHIEDHNDDFFKQTGLSKAVYKHNTISHDIRDNVKKEGWELKNLGSVRSLWLTGLNYKGIACPLHVRAKALTSAKGVHNEDDTPTVQAFQGNDYDPKISWWENEAILPSCDPIIINIWVGSYWINKETKSSIKMIIPDGDNQTPWVHEIDYIENGIQTQLNTSVDSKELTESYEEKAEVGNTVKPKTETFSSGVPYSENAELKKLERESKESQSK